MCIAIPAKVVEIDGEKGVVNLGGVNKEIMFTFTPEAKKGDWVLMHTGFALNVISEDDAQETLKLFEELEKSYETV
ncbi:MAG: HypC/HybG/HupF family hydrogenase formation chaperone [Candidatus Cloacimonetes bacterium]|nr:HypC/HybG/HupF family hydrogenase formation chaperone [Candidatus Cloacimonadota bacterium]